MASRAYPLPQMQETHKTSLGKPDPYGSGWNIPIRGQMAKTIPDLCGDSSSNG